MRRQIFTLVLFGGFAGILWAEDEVTLRSREKPEKGFVKNETPKGIVLEKGKVKETFNSDDIVDIYYDLPATPDLKFGAYSGARKEEKDSVDPSKADKRKSHILGAVEKYKEAFLKSKDPAPRRHFQFRIAMLQARLAQEEGDAADAAIKSLVEFKSKFPASWQIVPVMQTLAQLHLSGGEYKEASGVYEEMAGLELPEEAQIDAQIQSATVTLRAKKPDEAMKKLQGLLAKLPKGSKSAVRAQVALGECLAAQDKTDEAIGLLRGIIKDASDKGIKAAAYNALGESYMKKEQYKEARWEFLWVDVVYNQNRGEHARALYNLAKTFDALGDGDRALECRESLATDRQFAGLQEQRLAQKELGGEKKGKSK